MYKHYTCVICILYNVLYFIYMYFQNIITMISLFNVLKNCYLSGKVDIPTVFKVFWIGRNGWRIDRIKKLIELLWSFTCWYFVWVYTYVYVLVLASSVFLTINFMITKGRECLIIFKIISNGRSYLIFLRDNYYYYWVNVERSLRLG